MYEYYIYMHDGTAVEKLAQWSECLDSFDMSKIDMFEGQCKQLCLGCIRVAF